MFNRIIVVSAIMFTLTTCIASAGDYEMRKDGGFRSARIVFIGDSLTDGFTWPMFVRQALSEAGKDVPAFINDASGGDTAGERLACLDQAALKYEPTMAIILLGGGNDASKKRTPEQYAADLDEMITRLKANKTTVVMLSGSFPGPKHHLKAKGPNPYRVQLRTIAQKHAVQLIDTEDAMRRAWGLGIWLWEADQGHLNVDGCRVIARAVLDGLGYADVLLPEKLKIEPLPGLVREWKMKAVEKGAPPLDEKTVAGIRPDGSWKTLALPESEPQENWWMDQVRQEGYALSTDKLIGKADTYLGIAAIRRSHVRADKDGQAFLNTGAHLKTVWLNGTRVFQSTGWTGFHAGKERIPIQLKAGDNTLVIETGGQFALNITEGLLW
ncbi:MAG TPA: SGNH/GDSL hydrolase family protein [Planctomycetota bacterium]|nr:SGNH/GDSL hydrolase family protein [Planctomycetota bacterium]